MSEENLTEKFRKLISANKNIKPKKACEALSIEYNDSTRQLFYQAKRSVKNVKIVKSPKQKVIDQGHDVIPPQNNMTYTDDPDELLMSVAIRELNRPDPDPRWASILINCKKENISNKNEVLDQFKQLPTQALVNILNKSLQKEP